MIQCGLASISALLWLAIIVPSVPWDIHAHGTAAPQVLPPLLALYGQAPALHLPMRLSYLRMVLTSGYQVGMRPQAPAMSLC
jgi:hypothetical protein